MLWPEQEHMREWVDVEKTLLVVFLKVDAIDFDNAREADND